MRGLLIALAIASAVMIVQGYARSEQVNGGSYLAQVEQVIVEVRPGVYAPRPAGARMPGTPQWVNVTFPEPLEDGRTSVNGVPGNLAQEGDWWCCASRPRGSPKPTPL
jgi:hypothetical protein